MKLRCIIVDDEQLIRELLEDNVRQVPFLELVASCRNAMEAAEVLQKEQIDLIFLDIQMPRLSGLKFLQTLQVRPLIILITAYEKYAIEGFNLQVADYILKPLSFERFLKACNRAAELHRLKELEAKKETITRDFFFVNVEYTRVKISFTDIIYIESLKDYIKIFLSSPNKPVLTGMALKRIEEIVPSGVLIRTHKSYLVAVSKITSIKRDFVCIGNIEIPVSETFKENVDKIIAETGK